MCEHDRQDSFSDDTLRRDKAKKRKSDLFHKAAARSAVASVRKRMGICKTLCVVV